MIPTSGIFSKREDGERARDLLSSRGVPAGEMNLEPVRQPFWVNLVELNIPTDEALLYEPYFPSSAWMLFVKTERLPLDQIDEVVEQERGVVLRDGVAPPLSDLAMKRSDEV
jgi:hypothetical protein